MKTADQIIGGIVAHIRQLYAQPEYAVRDFGELDAVLYTLHWLYADATGTMDDFVRVRWSVFERDRGANFQRILKRKESHEQINCVADAAELISEWKVLDHELGLTL